MSKYVNKDFKVARVNGLSRGFWYFSQRRSGGTNHIHLFFLNTATVWIHFFEIDEVDVHLFVGTYYLNSYF